jgi:hypothetical protein
LGVKGRNPFLLRGAEGGINFVRVACFAICLSFSALASIASAETAGAHVALSGNSPDKTTLITKSDVACNVLGASKSSCTCLESLSTIGKYKSRTNIQFADVPSPAEFDRYRVIASISIPSHFVKTKNFLNKLFVVLLNDERNPPSSSHDEAMEINDQLQGGICV